MSQITKTLVRGFAVPIIAVLISSSLPLRALGQDAFYSLGDSSTDPPPFQSLSEGDSFASGSAPQLQGTTSGVMVESPEDKQETENIATLTGQGVRIQGDEFRRATRLPSSRLLLGLSICDLSYRPIVCDEVKAAADMPPLPKQITLARTIAEGQITSESVPGSSFEMATQKPQTVLSMLFSSSKSPLPVPEEVVVSADAVEEMSNANYAAACNPDFGSRFAAYCMELEHTGKVASYLKGAVEGLREAEFKIPAAYHVMARLKMAIAQIEASKASAAERAALASKLEREGKVYEALVERLRCVDLLDDGLSRLELAKLYLRIKEPKLGFETLRDAAQKTWPKNQAAKLAEVHYLMGTYISALSKEALKNGNMNLSLVRLQLASACFRRTVCLDRSNSDAVMCLVQVAKQGTTMDDSFDNQLMLGGAYYLAGDLERAKSAYDECQVKNRDDRRLKQARALLETTLKQKNKSQTAQNTSGPGGWQ